MRYLLFRVTAERYWLTVSSEATAVIACVTAPEAMLIRTKPANAPSGSTTMLPESPFTLLWFMNIKR